MGQRLRQCLCEGIAGDLRIARVGEERLPQPSAIVAVEPLDAADVARQLRFPCHMRYGDTLA